MNLRAEFNGTIDSESGMILNLKDVDSAFHKILEEPTIFRSRKSCLTSLYTQAKKVFPKHIGSLSLSSERLTLGYDGVDFVYSYRTSSNFYVSKNLIKLNIVLSSRKPLKRMWIQKFCSQLWPSTEKCLQSLKDLKGPLISVEIERPELGGWEKWYLEDSV